MCVRASFPFLVLLLTCVIAASETQAQGPRAQQRLAAQQQALRNAHNEQALLVVTSHQQHSYVGMAADIAGMLGESGEIRLVPVMGSGGAGNVKDLLYLRGADMAILPSNVLLSGKAGEALGGNLQTKLAYVTSLYGEEVHVLAGRSVNSIEDLGGKKVAVPLADGNALFSAIDVLQRLGIKADIVQTDPVSAMDQIRSGEIAAALLVGGKPLPLVSGLPKDGSLRLLGLRSSLTLEEGYAPAVFRADDYPTLIPPDAMIETVSVSAILLTRTMKDNDESYRRVEKFVPLFFRGLTELAGPPRHPKWSDVNLGAALTGWTRFGPAQQWLDSAKTEQAAWLQKSFEDFLRLSNVSGATPLSPAQRQKLFDEFVSWTRKPAQSTRQ
ncbi:MAG: TAXI family TRAP transporter solute-binding subunit [Hyphomicrobiaceae bacterium]